MIEITKNTEEKIVNCGALGYNASKIASVLDVSQDEVAALLDDPNSQFSKLIQKGEDMCDYVIDLKLFELAKSGDLKALDAFEYRKKKRLS